MQKLNIKIKRNEKIIKQASVSIPFPLSEQDFIDAVSHIFHDMDIEVPVILSKHVNELNLFLITKFLPDDFIDKIDFTRAET